MTALERRCAEAIAEAVAPPHAQVDIAPTASTLGPRLALILAHMPRLKRTAMRLGIGLLWLWPLLAAPLRGPRGTLTSLPPEERLRYLKAWRYSPSFLRHALGLGVIAVVLQAYFGDDVLAASIGYVPGLKQVSPAPPAASLDAPGDCDSPAASSAP